MKCSISQLLLAVFALGLNTFLLLQA